MVQESSKYLISSPGACDNVTFLQPFYRIPAYLVGIMSGLVWAEWGNKMHKAAAHVKRKAASAGAFMFATACLFM